MGRHKKYTGYKSWQYLEQRTDYATYPLAKQVDRVPPYDLGLSKSEEERVEEIIEKNIVISLHEHLGIYPEKMDVGRSRSGRRFTAYEGLAYSGLDAVFDNNVGYTWDDVIADQGMKQCDFAHQDFVIPALEVKDIINAFKTGRIALIATIEQATAIDREVDKIDVLYGLGIRSIGITYSESNALGDGLNELRDGGLTDLGYDAVKRMNKTGILIDVSHCGDQTARDTIEASDKPIIISHRGTRTLTNNTRMLPDDILQVMAEKGGVLGIEVAGFGLRTEKHPKPTIEGFMEHMEYCIDLLGIDHVGAGPDTLYGDHAELYRSRGRERAIGGYGHYPRPRPPGSVPQFDSVALAEGLDYIKGLESPSDFINIPRWLVKHGYSDKEIAKIIGGNGLRLLKAVWWR